MLIIYNIPSDRTRCSVLNCAKINIRDKCPMAACKSLTVSVAEISNPSPSETIGIAVRLSINTLTFTPLTHEGVFTVSAHRYADAKYSGFPEQFHVHKNGANLQISD